MSYWLIIRLWTYLADLNEQAQERLSLIVEQMMLPVFLIGGMSK